MLLKEVDEVGLDGAVGVARLEDGVASPALMRLGSGVECDTEEVESTRGRRLEEEEVAWESWLLAGESDCIPNCALTA